VPRRLTTGDSVRYSSARGITSELSGERVVVLDRAGEFLITLSPVGAIVWRALPADFDTMVKQLVDRFPDVEESTIASDLERYLAELQAAGLVDVADAAD
jgi:Coenzyme PQQ synthesis protein D (PqqD)/CUE domain